MQAVAEVLDIEAHSAHNYSPLPVVIQAAEGAWVVDTDGNRYLDALSAYSALNFGHRNPRVMAAVREQMERVTLTSRAFYHDRFGEFCRAVSRLTGKEAVLPMNTGAEAVETAIKAARRWGYHTRGLSEHQATIIVADGNFHGRTTTIVGFSTDPDSREGFGPFAPGFISVPFGNLAAVEAAIAPATVAVLLEPIQGEAGVVIPPKGFLSEVRSLTAERGVLMIADEIQSGLGRTGWTFACDREEVVPDIYVLGKALGGGVLPVSAIAADRDVMDVFTPGSHGSTFGGNPLACAAAIEVVRMLETGEFQEHSRRLGEALAVGLGSLPPDYVTDIRCSGLWAGIDLAPGLSAKDVCLAMMRRGVLAKDTHYLTVRIAPPLTITEDEVDLIVSSLREAIHECAEDQ